MIFRASTGGFLGDICNQLWKYYFFYETLGLVQADPDHPHSAKFDKNLDLQQR